MRDVAGMKERGISRACVSPERRSLSPRRTRERQNACASRIVAREGESHFQRVTLHIRFRIERTRPIPSQSRPAWPEKRTGRRGIVGHGKTASCLNRG